MLCTGKNDSIELLLQNNILCSRTTLTTENTKAGYLALYGERPLTFVCVSYIAAEIGF